MHKFDIEVNKTVEKGIHFIKNGGEYKVETQDVFLPCNTRTRLVYHTIDILPWEKQNT